MNGTLLPALIGAPLVAALAWRVRALTPSGALGAAGVGFCHLAFAGWLGAGALLAFFGTSTLLSRLGKRRKDADRTCFEHALRPAVTGDGTHRITCDPPVRAMARRCAATDCSADHQDTP